MWRLSIPSVTTLSTWFLVRSFLTVVHHRSSKERRHVDAEETRDEVEDSLVFYYNSLCYNSHKIIEVSGEQKQCSLKEALWVVFHWISISEFWSAHIGVLAPNPDEVSNTYKHQCFYSIISHKSFKVVNIQMSISGQKNKQTYLCTNNFWVLKRKLQGILQHTPVLKALCSLTYDVIKRKIS